MNKQGARFAAYGGHLVDLWRLARFQYANPHSYSKFRNIKTVARRTGATQMIETGTFLGNTAMACAPYFRKLYTIELDEALAASAAAYLKRRPNVEVIRGDAAVELPKILERPDVNELMVYLDGHFSGGVTALGDVPEPACMEIETLGRFRDKIRGVVIDDFRSFGTEPGFPSKSDLLHSVEKHFNNGYEILIHLDQVLIMRKPATAAAMR
jgi:hypothetical protein